MKKSIIAAGAASVALAAMPIVGTFAATVASVQDKVTLTVDSACSMDATVDAAGFNTYSLGTHTPAYEFPAVDGTPMTITCNNINGWNITASATDMSDAAATTTTSQTIAFGAYPSAADISAGTAASTWSAKVALSGNNVANAQITTGWADYTNPAATPVVAHVSDTTGAKAVSGLIVTPSYKAYVAADQASATYAGTITYTFNAGS